MTPIIYCDLDGVIVDFDPTMKKIGWDKDRLSDKKYYNAFWEYLTEATNNGMLYWEIMDPMPDYMVLWNVIKDYNPTILSSSGGVRAAIKQKANWVHKYLGAHVPIKVTDSSANKARYASPTSILIDDRMKSLDPWMSAGGIGILHTDAVSTIEKLNKIIAELNSQ